MAIIKKGDVIIMTVEELELEREAAVIKTIEKVKAMIVSDTPTIRTLNIDGVMVLFKKKRSAIDSYRKRKKNPLPMVGTPPLIEEDVAWEWYANHSGDYQSE